MNKQLKKDNTLFNIIFILCATILLLGISNFITDYQYKGIKQENYTLNIENTKLKDEISDLKIGKELQNKLKDIAIEDIATLRAYYNEVVFPYMDNFEELTYEYDSLVVDIYNDMSWIMTDYQERTFENRLDDLQSDWKDLSDELGVEVDEWTENNPMFY